MSAALGPVTTSLSYARRHALCCSRPHHGLLQADSRQPEQPGANSVLSEAQLMELQRLASAQTLQLQVAAFREAGLQPSAVPQQVCSWEWGACCTGNALCKAHCTLQARQEVDGLRNAATRLAQLQTSAVLEVSSRRLEWRPACWR